MSSAEITSSIPYRATKSWRSAASWTTISVAAAAMVATLPARTNAGLGMITEPLLADFGLERVALAQINLVTALVGALFCFSAGRLLDRSGLRVALAVVALGLSAAVVGLSFSVGTTALVVCLLLLRGFGQSALSVVSIAIVGKSFDRRESWPMAAYAVILTMGFMVAFPTVGYCLQQFDWRATWRGIALLIAAGLVPAAWLLPARMAARTDDSASADATTGGLSLREALATPVFWAMAGATALFGLASSGLGLNNEAVLAERGFDKNIYYITLSVSALTGLMGQVGCGWLARHWSYQRLTALAMTIYAAALLGLTSVKALGPLMACAVLLGVSGGMITVIFFAVWGRMFGRRHLGRIQGAAQLLTVVASAVGPLVFAEFQARTGTFASALYWLGGAVVVVGLGALLVAEPRGEDSHAVVT